MNTISSTTAPADGAQVLNKKITHAPQAIAVNSVSENSPVSVVSSDVPDIGPAYEVEISAVGKELSQNSTEDAAAAIAAESQKSSQAEQAKKHQQDWRIQSDVVRMKQTEQNIRAHEAAHMAAGGSFTGGVSYVYTKGPDGKLYVTGGEVPIQAPEGKTPEETIKNMEIVQRAAMAPPDPSGQDLAVAAAAMQIANRARAAIRQGRFLTQDDMQENSQAGTLSRPPVWPTSMAGLIGTLMPPEGMYSRPTTTRAD